MFTIHLFFAITTQSEPSFRDAALPAEPQVLVRIILHFQAHPLGLAHEAFHAAGQAGHGMDEGAQDHWIARNKPLVNMTNCSRERTTQTC